MLVEEEMEMEWEGRQTQSSQNHTVLISFFHFCLLLYHYCCASGAQCSDRRQTTPTFFFIFFEWKEVDLRIQYEKNIIIGIDAPQEEVVVVK